MAAEQGMIQAIMQAVTETSKADIVAIREAEKTVNNARPVHAAPRSGSPAQKQPTFDWKVQDKYQELCNFEIEVKNIL